ncbi:hypothetical protein [Fangia hongkongensis]|uniref:hypothetical protein n=1 Tax=Fangia hongkongensis TaxID=270495 RepID=UPI000379E615|nr:hypothetical protein [Fangia hongkongensis]MBK2126171.1 hypothetical protein [Fangia hongkongensis]
MANQYQDSLPNKIQAVYHRSAQSVLSDFSAQNLSYQNVSEIIGCKVVTVKKWCRLYHIRLQSDAPPPAVKLYLDRYRKHLKAARIDRYNILYHKWPTEKFV